MFVYLIKNTMTNKIYVGQTTRPLSVRLAEHVSQALRGVYRSYFHSSIRKHGAECLEISLLEEASSLEELSKKETEWIDRLHATDFRLGYNLKKEGNSNAGKNNPMYGKSRRDLANYNRDAKKGKTWEQLYGPRRAAEMKLEQSRRNRGKSRPASEAQRLKISRCRRGKVAWEWLVKDEQTGEINTTLHFCNKYNVEQSSMYNHLRRKSRYVTKEKLIFTRVEKRKGA